MIECSTPVIDHNLISTSRQMMDKSKRAWKQFQHAQDILREMFPGLVKKDLEAKKNVKVQSNERDKEKYRYDFY